MASQHGRTKRAPRFVAAAALPGAGTYFTGMTIRDVRCFGPEQSMTMVAGDGAPARWTVILGENGVGKTTLLQMLALLAVEDSAEVEYLLAREMFEAFELRRRPPHPGRLSASLRRTDDGGGDTSATFVRDGKTYRHRIEAGRREAVPTKYPLAQSPFLCGYGANRRLGYGRLLRHREPRLSFLSLFGDVELRDSEEWLLQADYAATRDKAPRAQHKRALVERLLVRLLPDVKAVRIVDSKRYDSPTVEVDTPYGWVAIHDLSLGYQALIAWMVDLSSRFLERFPDSKDPLAEPAIVLVDEIDLHLHPKWQRQLMSYLSELFPATQFIATAHSPLVVQGAGDANVVVLRREGDHVQIETGADEIKYWRIDQILTSDLYGLPSARPPHLDDLLAMRRELLTKPKLTAADERKLRALQDELGQLPGGESPDELRAMELIERAAKLIDQPRKRSRR